MGIFRVVSSDSKNNMAFKLSVRAGAGLARQFDVEGEVCEVLGVEEVADVVEGVG